MAGNDDRPSFIRQLYDLFLDVFEDDRVDAVECFIEQEVFIPHRKGEAEEELALHAFGEVIDPPFRRKGELLLEGDVFVVIDIEEIVVELE